MAEAAKTQTEAASEGVGRKTITGTVISDKRDKTITVEVGRLVKHARYGKYVFRSTNFHAHDEKNEAKLGDLVEIKECRPMSKQKRHKLVRVVEAAALAPTVNELKEVEVLAAKKKDAAEKKAAETK